MQDFYDKEIYDKEKVIKRLKGANDSYEKQQARDKMIIKFRESTISNFGGKRDKLLEEDCRKEVNNLKEEVKYLKLQIEENPKLVKSYADITELKKRIADMSNDSTDSEFQTKESINNMYKSCMEFIDELKDYIDYSEEKRQEQNSKIFEELNKKIDMLKNEIKEAEAQTDGYRELLSNFQSEYDAKIKELDDEISMHKKEVQAHKDQAHEYKAEIHKYKVEINDLKEKEIEGLKNRLIEEERAKHEWHNKSQSLYEEKLSLHAEKESLNAEKDTLNAEKLNLHADLELLNNEKETLNAEKNSLQTEKMTVEKLFDEMKTQYLKTENDYKEQIASLNSDSLTLNEEISQLKRIIESYKDKVESMNSSLQLKDEKITFLLEIKSIKENLEVDYKNSKDQNKHLSESVKSKEQEIDNLTKSNKEISDKLNDCELKIKNLSEELDTNESQYKFNLSDLRTKNQNLAVKLDVTENQLLGTKQELEDEIEKSELLKKEFKDKSDKTQNEYKSKVDQILEEKKSTINSLKDNIKSLEDQIKDFEIIKDQHQSDMEIKASEIHELEQEVLDIMKERDEYKEMIFDVVVSNENSMASTDDTNFNLSEQMEELKNQLTSLKTTNEAQASEIEELKDENLSINKSYKETLNSLNQLKQEQAKLHFQLNSNTKSQNNGFHSSYESEIKQLKNELIECKNKLSEASNFPNDENTDTVPVPELDINKLLKHPAIKKLLHTIKRIKKESQELTAENESLNEQLNKFSMLEDSESRLNPSSKIKHFQKIKDENNFLK